MSLIDREIELVQNLNLLPTWEDKYQYIIELGENLPKLTEIDKTDKNLIKGCQSKLWLTHQVENNKIQFFADSESPFPKGLAALFLKIVNDLPPLEILTNKIDVLERTKLKYHLSPTRYRGVSNLYKTILDACRQYENLDR